MSYEGSTATGARSGRTGATGVMDQGTGSNVGTGSGAGTGRSGNTGTGSGVGTGSGRSGMTGSATTGGVSEGFRGLNITGSSGVRTLFHAQGSVLYQYLCCSPAAHSATILVTDICLVLCSSMPTTPLLETAPLSATPNTTLRYALLLCPLLLSHFN